MEPPRRRFRDRNRDFDESRFMDRDPLHDWGYGSMGYDRDDIYRSSDASAGWDQPRPRRGMVDYSGLGKSWQNREPSRHDEPSMFERIGEKVGEFFGKGPKGYRRSDERIREDVSEALYRHPYIDASDVEVSVSEGVVSLSGTVTDRRTKRMIEDEAERVPGVHDVTNNLRLKDSGANLQM